jgi:hypothetical protein
MIVPSPTKDDRHAPPSHPARRPATGLPDRGFVVIA